MNRRRFLIAMLLFIIAGGLAIVAAGITWPR